MVASLAAGTEKSSKEAKIRTKFEMPSVTRGAAGTEALSSCGYCTRNPRKFRRALERKGLRDLISRIRRKYGLAGISPGRGKSDTMRHCPSSGHFAWSYSGRRMADMRSMPHANSGPAPP